MAWNKSDPLVVVLDNRTTAMTGHQPTPGVGVTDMGEPTKALKLEELAKACGADHVRTVNCFDIASTEATARELLAKPGLKVLIANGECRLLWYRRARAAGIRWPTWTINRSKCTKCGVCIESFGCPPFIAMAKQLLHCA